MKTVTVATKLTEKMIKMIDKLIEKGIYVNRSDALRDAARILIRLQYGAMGRRKSIFLTKREKDKALKEYAKERGLDFS